MNYKDILSRIDYGDHVKVTFENGPEIMGTIIGFEFEDDDVFITMSLDDGGYSDVSLSDVSSIVNE